MACLKYNDAETCPGYEANKLCAACDKNARLSPEERIKNTMMATHKATCADKTDSSDKVKAAMDKILKLFESDNLEIMARAVFKYPEGSTYAKPSDNWSFINRMLMMIENTEDARGFRQWKSAGRNVTKGSHAFYIFAPKIAKIEDDKTHEEKTILTGFMTIPVFRYEDTEGESLPEAPKFEFKIPANFDGIIQELGLKIKTAPAHDAYGYYSPSQKIITMCSPDVAVFLHELSHAVDTQVLKNEKQRAGQETDREVVAEYSAAVVGHMLGLKVSSGNSKKYIEAYSLKELMRQLNRCEKVISFIWDRTTQGAQNQPLSVPMAMVRT